MVVQQQTSVAHELWYVNQRFLSNRNFSEPLLVAWVHIVLCYSVLVGSSLILSLDTMQSLAHRPMVANVLCQRERPILTSFPLPLCARCWDAPGPILNLGNTRASVGEIQNIVCDYLTDNFCRLAHESYAPVPLALCHHVDQ